MPSRSICALAVSSSDSRPVALRRKPIRSQPSAGFVGQPRRPPERVGQVQSVEAEFDHASQQEFRQGHRPPMTSARSLPPTCPAAKSRATETRAVCGPARALAVGTTVYLRRGYDPTTIAH